MKLIIQILALFALNAAPVAAQEISTQATAALATRDAGKPTFSENWMISAANPLAVQAGADVLRKGGTAADAMVAVQAVLGLVEPHYISALAPPGRNTSSRTTPPATLPIGEVLNVHVIMRCNAAY